MTLKPRSNGFMRVIAYALMLLLCRCLAAPAYAVDVSVASPWIGEIVSFIGGSNVNVRYLTKWDANGKLVSSQKPKMGEIIIALDAGDVSTLRIKPDDSRLRLLYYNLSIAKELRYSVFFDPAMLPFIAQSVMKVLAEADAPRYSVYQRRLAEFQSRIDSTVDIGRYMLGEAKALDITGAAGAWVRSAMPGAVRPPAHVWNAWMSGDEAALSAALAEAAKRGWLILLDPWTPADIRAAATAYENRLTLPLPAKNQDYIAYLYDIFIVLSNHLKDTEKKSK